jgi:hypothetical protein
LGLRDVVLMLAHFRAPILSYIAFQTPSSVSDSLALELSEVGFLIRGQ